MLYNTQCCGVKEASGLYGKSTLENLKRICSDRYSRGINSAYIIITDTVESGRGGELVDLIRSGDFGTIIEAPTEVNPNSNNEIGIWIFIPNDEKLITLMNGESTFVISNRYKSDEKRLRQNKLIRDTRDVLTVIGAGASIGILLLVVYSVALSLLNYFS